MEFKSKLQAHSFQRRALEGRAICRPVLPGRVFLTQKLSAEELAQWETSAPSNTPPREQQSAVRSGKGQLLPRLLTHTNQSPTTLLSSYSFSTLSKDMHAQGVAEEQIVNQQDVRQSSGMLQEQHRYQ